MRYRFAAVFAFISIAAIHVDAQTGVTTAADTAFEMPGVFRISLPQGWRQSKVIDDRHAVAVFSNNELTLEVIRDTSSETAEQYAQSVTERRMRPEADGYPGKYAPAEVRAKPGDFQAEITHRFDEYTVIGGLPTRWARYRWHYTHPEKEGDAAKSAESKKASVHDAIVWSVFTLSPRDYWSLELRGDEAASWPVDLKRMVRSFQLLDPTLSHAKAAIPKEAWQRAPSNLANGTCQFAGVGSGMGALLPCDMDVVQQEEYTAPEDATIATLLGLERLGGTSMPSVSFQHVTGSGSPEEFMKGMEKKVSDALNSDTVEGWNGKYGRAHCYTHQDDKDEDDDDQVTDCYRDPKTVTEKLSYHQDSSREVMVDGHPGTVSTGTATAKKTKRTVSNRLLVVSAGTDHFVLNIYFNPADCKDCPVDQIVNSVRVFALRPKVEAMPNDTDEVCKGLMERMASKLFAHSPAPGETPASAVPPTQSDPAADKRCLEKMATKAEQEVEDARLLNNSDYHVKLGRGLESGGKKDAALSEYRAAVRLNPRNEDANRAISPLYASRNDMFDAIAAYERILYYEADADKDEKTHAQLASLYAQAGANVLAASHLSMAGTQAPKNIMPDADLEATNKQLDTLSAQMEKANKDYETNPTTENSLADADLGLQVGDFTGADRICRGVLDVDQKNQHALACLADTSYVRGEGDSVIEYAQQWLALAPDDPNAHSWLARGYSCDPADYKKAAENYEAVVRHANDQLQPSALQEAENSWPKSYEDGGMWPEAASAHEAVAGLFPSDAHVLNNAAWFFATTSSNMKNPAKALEYAKRAVTAAPKDPNIVDTLAEAYFANGRAADAISTEQKALALAPESEDLLKQMEKFKQAKSPRKK